MRTDRGASSLEYIGLIVFAAMIAAVLFTVIPTPLGDHLSGALCRILDITDAAKCKDAGQGKKPTDIKPQWCLSSMHSDGFDIGWKGTIKKIIDLSIGRGYRMIRYDSREEDVDGKVKHFVYLSFVDKGDASIDLGKAKKGNKISLGAGAEVQYGEMYRMTPEQAEEFTQGIQGYQQAKLEQDVGGVPGAVGVNSIGQDWPDLVTHPAITYGQTTGTGEGNLDGKVPLNKLPAPEKYVLPNGGSVNGEYNKTLLTEHWNIYKDADGNVLPATAVYHSTSGSVSYGVNRQGKVTRPSTREGAGKAGVNRTLNFSNTTRVTTDDKTGDLKSIRYVVTYGDSHAAGTQAGLTGKKPSADGDGPSIGGKGTSGNGKLHTEVIQLNFDTPEEQAIGKEWLAEHGTEMPPSVVNQMISKSSSTPGVPDDKQVAEPPGPGAGKFDQLVFNKAMGWKTDADTTSKSLNINAQIPFAAGQIGPSLTLESEDAKTKKAQILDRPGADGSRHWIDYPDCTAAGNH